MTPYRKQINNFFKYKRKTSLFSLIIFSVITFLTSCGGESGGGTPTNNKPISSAGINQSVSTGSTVSLNGVASSDSDGDTLSFQWSFSSLPTSSNAILSDTTSELPTFVADVTGDFILQLIVNDGTEDSTADLVTITVSEENSLPVANAGSDQNVSIGSTVRLDGSSSSDIDGNMLSFQWSFSSLPTSSNAILSDTTSVLPTFVADVTGSYVLQLIVNNGIKDSTVDLVAVMVSQGNSAPVADAGSDRDVTINSLVNLSGLSSTDSDGDNISYSWSFSSLPAGSNVTLNGQDTASPSFIADTEGTYLVQLVVNDGSEDSATDSVAITVTFFNAAPVANAGDNQNVKTGTLVSIDGSASTDADGDALFYTWSFVSKPTASTAVLDNNNLINPTFITDVDGNYVLSLTVNDGLLDSNAANITINAAEGFSQLFLESNEGTFNEVVFASETTVTDLPTSNNEYSLATYKLVAPSSNFTITNVHATEANGLVTPYFDNLLEGDELNSGEELLFTLVTPLVNTTSLNVSFSFDILETGDRFSSEFTIPASDVILPIVRIEPKYPVQEARDGTEGWVLLSFAVNEVGGVEDVVVLDANPNGVFDNETERALRKWKFKPVTVDDIPVRVDGLTVLFEFKLDG